MAPERKPIHLLWRLSLAGDEQQWRAQRAHERRASGAQELRFALAKRGPNHHEIVDACSSRAADLDFWARMDHGQASYGDAALPAQPPRVYEERQALPSRTPPQEFRIVLRVDNMERG